MYLHSLQDALGALKHQKVAKHGVNIHIVM